MRNDNHAKFNDWLAAAEHRYAADLRVQEITRALRALSSSYVERRERGSGQRVRGALDTAGKRAAFALYYAPLHFIAVAEAVNAIGAHALASGSILDLGCGTGAAGASWAIASGSSTPVIGVDKHPWAVSEARWTYAQLAVNGVAKQGDIDRQLVMRRGDSVIAAYTLNELSDAGRDRVEKELVQRSQQGGRILVVEPLARGVAPWWPRMAERFKALGGRADEWKVTVDVPPIVRRLGTAAGLDYRQLRFQTLLV